MRKISADYIFPVSSPPIKNGVITVDDKGKILLVESESSYDTEIEKLDGLIVPGFVNAHCHLELSYLKGELAEGRGLAEFIMELGKKRETYSSDQVKSAIEQAEEEMIKEGIVAVGDISNTNYSFDQKKKNRIAYHTFLEIYDLVEENTENKISKAKSLCVELNHRQISITPHASYSVSEKMIELIDKLKQPFVSIHNQESNAENELFSTGTGLLAELLKKTGVDIRAKQRANHPLIFTLGNLIETKKIMLVHNTYTSKSDIELIRNYCYSGNLEVTFCLCPRANLYIENRLPDIPMLMKSGMKITLGTDSYASNKSLSIIEEMKVISSTYGEVQIPFQNLLTWATKNGAEFLGMEKEFGTIEKGKKPGLNLLKGMSEKLELTEKTFVCKLI